MKQKSIPAKGLVVFSSYKMYTRRGEFTVIDIETGQLVAWRKFRNAITSDNVIAVLSICAACQFCLDNKYVQKIYCTSEVAYKWAKDKQVKTKSSSPGMIKLVEEKLKVVDFLDFPKSVELWNPDWGNMKDYLDYLDTTRGSTDNLPF